ncbi:MAG: hypothetical protein AB1486_24490 [Planctomycetota bacterium]
MMALEIVVWGLYAASVLVFLVWCVIPARELAALLRAHRERSKTP